MRTPRTASKQASLTAGPPRRASRAYTPLPHSPVADARLYGSWSRPINAVRSEIHGLTAPPAGAESDARCGDEFVGRTQRMVRSFGDSVAISVPVSVTMTVSPTRAPKTSGTVMPPSTAKTIPGSRIV